MVRREQGESGDDAYWVSAKLVHRAIYSILGSLIVLGGYMAAWAYADAKWKATITERQNDVRMRLAEVERRVRELEARER